MRSLAALIVAAGLASGSAQTSGTAIPVSKQLIEMKPNSLVEVRLEDKKKIRGRLGETGKADFEVKVAVQDKIETQRYRYADVKSVKTLENTRGAGKTGWFLIGMAVGAAVILGVAYAVVAALGGV